MCCGNTLLEVKELSREEARVFITVFISRRSNTTGWFKTVYIVVYSAINSVW